MSIGQETRRESLAKVDTLTEEAKIYEVLSRTPVPLTASETSYELGYGYNRQKTQPRINGLKDKGIVIELCKKYDPRTKRHVTAYWLTKRKAPDEAGPLDKGASKNTAVIGYRKMEEMSNGVDQSL